MEKNFLVSGFNEGEQQENEHRTSTFVKPSATAKVANVNKFLLFLLTLPKNTGKVFLNGTKVFVRLMSETNASQSGGQRNRCENF